MRMGNRMAVSMFGQKRLSREGGIEIVVKELCTRMAQKGLAVTCYNRSGHHVSGAEYDRKTEYKGICQKYVPTIERKGLAAVSSSFFAALCSAFGKYDVVHIHAEGPAFFALLPKMSGKRVIVTVHGIDWQREKWKSGFGSKFIRQGEKNAVMVVVACSSAEYGQTLNELENPYVLETAELKPLHPYGVSKVGQDLLSFQYFMNDHIRCIRVRIFNSTGTRKTNDVTSDFTKRAVLAELPAFIDFELEILKLGAQ